MILMPESERPEHELTEVAEALYRGQKIEAIKFYRERYNVGLKEAKDAVEELESGLRERSPHKFAAPPSRAGCLGVFLLAVFVARAVAATIG
jgi:hypothetical protein